MEEGMYIGGNCVICEKKKHRGYYLYTSFICTECEKKLIETDTCDPRYHFYIKQLRKINRRQILF